jgi:hypothetical protein
MSSLQYRSFKMFSLHTLTCIGMGGPAGSARRHHPAAKPVNVPCKNEYRRGVSMILIRELIVLYFILSATSKSQTSITPQRDFADFDLSDHSKTAYCNLTNHITTSSSKQPHTVSVIQSSNTRFLRDTDRGPEHCSGLAPLTRGGARLEQVNELSRCSQSKPGVFDAGLFPLIMYAWHVLSRTFGGVIHVRSRLPCV